MLVCPSRLGPGPIGHPSQHALAAPFSVFTAAVQLHEISILLSYFPHWLPSTLLSSFLAVFFRFPLIRCLICLASSLLRRTHTLRSPYSLWEFSWFVVWSVSILHGYTGRPCYAPHESPPFNLSNNAPHSGKHQQLWPGQSRALWLPRRVRFF